MNKTKTHYTFVNLCPQDVQDKLEQQQQRQEQDDAGILDNLTRYLGKSKYQSRSNYYFVVGNKSLASVAGAETQKNKIKQIVLSFSFLVQFHNLSSGLIDSLLSGNLGSRTR